MKLALAQLNPTVGAIGENLKKSIEAIDLAAQKKADLIIFPELFLAGYPARDLLERPEFIAGIEAAMATLCQHSKGIPNLGIIMGLPLRDDHHKVLLNAAQLIYQGQSLFTQGKTLLPQYDVFDDQRYFTPPESINVVSFKGQKLGISICEDAWNIPELGSPYKENPIATLASQGATLMINLSASPFELGKPDVRLRIAKHHSQTHRVPFVLVNQVGGCDDLIFDGGSMLVANEAQVLLPHCKELVEIVDLESLGGTKETPESVNRETLLYEALVLGTRDFVKKSGLQNVFIGVSGGIDSAVTAAIAVEALGCNFVTGIAMPSPFSSDASVTDAKELAENLGIPLKIIPITDIYEKYLAVFKDLFPGKERDTTEENIQARIRGNLLMACANKDHALVLATGNKSELAVGYTTLYGDMCGAVGVLFDVYKQDVYRLAQHINRNGEIIPKSTIEKPPSAELKPNQKDQDTLPPYEILDQILKHYIEDQYSPEEIVKMGIDRDTVEWVVSAIHRNEYKRKQASPGLKVSKKAFGSGRRMMLSRDVPI